MFGNSWLCSWPHCLWFSKSCHWVQSHPLPRMGWSSTPGIMQNLCHSCSSTEKQIHIQGQRGCKKKGGRATILSETLGISLKINKVLGGKAERTHSKCTVLKKLSPHTHLIPCIIIICNLISLHVSIHHLARCQRRIICMCFLLIRLLRSAKLNKCILFNNLGFWGRHPKTESDFERSGTCRSHWNQQELQMAVFHS